MAATRRPVAYIRRSVARKGDQGDISRAFQTAKVRDLAGPDGPNLVVIDQDWGRSAARDKTEKRLAFLDLLASIERGEVSTLFAYSADRLARSVRWAAQLLDACQDNGTTIVTGEGRFPPGDGGARMVFQVLAIGNEHALESIIQKSTSSIAARRARGDDLGSYRYGYRTNKATRTKGERVVWERDPDSPLDEVLDVVRANGGNVLASCRELERRGIPGPRGGTHWATSALTRIIERETPDLRPPRVGRGKRQPTKSVLSYLVRCPHCDVFMTPIAPRDALYCRNGAKATIGGHAPDANGLRPKYFAQAAPILTMLHQITDGKTISVYGLVGDDGPNVDVEKARERWRRANKRYQHGGISDDEFEAEATRWKGVEATLTASEPSWRRVNEEGEALVRWDEDVRTVNLDLRYLVAEVRLDPTTMAPAEVVMRRPVRRPAVIRAGAA